MMSRMRWMCAASVFLVVFASFTFAGREQRPLGFGVSGSVVATDNRDATPADKESNVDVFLRPYIEWRLNTAATVLNLLYEPGLRYRMEPGDSQRELEMHHKLVLGLRHQLGPRSRMRVSNTFLKIDDPQISEGGAVLRANRSYIVNTLQAGLNYDLGHLSNVDFVLRSQVRRYDETMIARFSDKHEIGAGMAFRHSLTAKVRALLNAQYDHYSFKSEGFRSRDFDSMTGSIGLEYIFTPQVIGSISGGAQARSYDAVELETDENLFVRSELSGTLTQDLAVGVLAGVGVRDADVYPYASQEYAEVRSYADMQLSADLALRGAVTYRLSSYDAFPQLGLSGGDETVTVFDLQLTYSLNDLASLVAGHRYEDISADDGLSGDFTRNTSRVGMRLDF